MRKISIDINEFNNYCISPQEEVKKVFELFCNIFPEVADQVGHVITPTNQSGLFFSPIHPQCNEILNNFGEYWELFKGEVVSNKAPANAIRHLKRGVYEK